MRNTSAAGSAGSCRNSQKAVFIYLGRNSRVAWIMSSAAGHVCIGSTRLAGCWHEFSCEAGSRFRVSRSAGLSAGSFSCRVSIKQRAVSGLTGFARRSSSGRASSDPTCKGTWPGTAWEVKVLGSSDDRFREMFFEEAREHLISLEEGLMDLERRQGDRAHLDKTFRAAHTIKGAAAMVGLEPIARFTHGIEAVLEKIRTGSLAVDSDIITTLLESRDHLAAMVEGYAAGSPVPGSGDLSQRLSDLLRVTPPGPAPAPSRPAPEAGRPSRPEPGSVAGRP